MCCCLLLATALSSSPLTYLSVPKIKEWICLRTALTTKGFVSIRASRGSGAPGLSILEKPKTVAYQQHAHKLTVCVCKPAPDDHFRHLAFRRKAVRGPPLCTHSSCTVSTHYRLLHQVNNITFCPKPN